MDDLAPTGPCISASVSKYLKPCFNMVKTKVDLNLTLSANTHVAPEIKTQRALASLALRFHVSVTLVS